MRSIAIFFAFAIAFTSAGLVKETADGTIVAIDDGGAVEVAQFEEKTSGNFDVATGIKSYSCCTPGLCFDLCWAYGFRPTFSFQCIDCNTCRCIQY